MKQKYSKSYFSENTENWWESFYYYFFFILEYLLFGDNDNNWSKSINLVYIELATT